MLVAEIDISNPKFVHLIIKLLHSSGVMCVGVCCAGPVPMGPGDGMPPTEPKHRAEKEEGAMPGNEPPKSKVKASLFLFYFFSVYLSGFVTLCLVSRSVTALTSE